MKKLIKPQALKSGDIVATVSLSWGGAGLIPGRYNHGKKQFEDAFDVKIIEMPNSLKTDELYDNPKLRLDDLMDAFQNPDVKAILTNIGGDDTIRLLEYMTDEHFEIIKNNPKIFLGMSDTTANHFMCMKAGLSSFYSPTTMFGFGENCGIPEYIKSSVKKALFETDVIGTIPESLDFICEKIYWDDKNDIMRTRTKSTGWRYIQGDKIARGRLIGGCTELLTMMNGTKLWPELSEWEDTILFLENSEEQMSPEIFSFFLRNLGAAGILQKIHGILFARPGGEFTDDKTAERDKWISKYEKFDAKLLKICKEYNCEHIPIVTNMDFGHTVPQFLIPYGAMCEIDPIKKKVSIMENAVQSLITEGKIK